MIKGSFACLFVMAVFKTSVAQFGTIYNKNSWINTSDFITNGNTTAALSGNYINISSATTLNYSNTVYITGYTTKLSRWKFRAKFKIQAWASNSYGIGFGVKSINTNVQNDVFGFIQTSNTGIGGLYILKSDMTVLASGQNLGVALNDVIDVEAIFNDSVFTFNAYNITSGASRSLSYTYTWDGSPRVIPNTSRFALLELGGTHQLQNIEITSDEITGANIAVVGDSKTAGYFAGSFAGRYAAQLNNTYPATIINAGGGDKVTEALARKNELERLTAQKYLLCIGSNDLRFGGTMANLQSNYDSLVRLLQAAGAQVFHIVMPEDYSKSWAVNMLPFKNWVEATYGSFYIGGVWDSLASGNVLKNIYDWSDGIHLNQAGNNKVYEALLASGKLSGGTTLPVILYSFNARKIDEKKAMLQWKIGEASGVWSYDVMKSNDGVIFNRINHVLHASSDKYTCIDEHLSAGNNYYRLRITEYDGKITESKTVLVYNQKEPVDIISFQKHNAGEIHIVLDAALTMQIKWEVIDAAGRKIEYNSLRAAKGINTVMIPIRELNRGVYYIRIIPENNKKLSVFPFIK